MGRAGGETSSPRSSPIRCLGGFLSLTPRLIRSRSPHFLIHRRHLSARAVLGSSSIHAVIAISPRPRRTPERNDLRRHSSGHPSNAPPHDKQNEAKERDEVMACGSKSLPRSSFLVGSSLRIAARSVRRSSPIAYRPQGFHPGRGGNSRRHILFRAVFLSSSRPPSAHRLIRPTARRSIRTGGQANSRRKARR